MLQASGREGGGVDEGFGIRPRAFFLVWFSFHAGLVGILFAVNLHALLDSGSSDLGVLTSCVACLSVGSAAFGMVGGAIADARLHGWHRALFLGTGRIEWWTGAVARRAARAGGLPGWVAVSTWPTSLILLVAVIGTPFHLLAA